MNAETHPPSANNNGKLKKATRGPDALHERKRREPVAVATVPFWPYQDRRGVEPGWVRTKTRPGARHPVMCGVVGGVRYWEITPNYGKKVAIVCGNPAVTDQLARFRGPPPNVVEPMTRATRTARSHVDHPATRRTEQIATRTAQRAAPASSAASPRSRTGARSDVGTAAGRTPERVELGRLGARRGSTKRHGCCDGDGDSHAAVLVFSRVK